MTDSFLRLKEVLRITGLSRTSLYRYIDAGRFPRQVQVGPQVVAWSAADVARWVEERKVSVNSGQK